MKTYEVFLRGEGQESFHHAGALEAPDDDLAVLLAQECYARRGEGAELWVVERSNVLVADTDLLTNNADKPHRHSDGSAVAARRRTRRTTDR